MKDLFQKGVKIDDDIFTQERIKDPIKSNKLGLYPFYPTTLVTQPLFAKFLGQPKTPVMTFGPYGTAKSSAYILYWHLSAYVADYLFAAEKEEKKSFLALFKKNEIPNKLFYWSVLLE